MAGFRTIHINGAGDGIGSGQDRLRSRLRAAARAAPDDFGLTASVRPEHLNDEAACRLHIQTYLEDLNSETMLATTSPERPEAVPDLLTRSVAQVPDLQANSVVYQQSAKDIPIFGGRIVVDVDEADKTLVAINGQLAPVPDADPIAGLSPAQAWRGLIDWSDTDTAPDPGAAPVLKWYLDEEEKWHLSYHFSDVPLAPPEEPIPEGFEYEAIPCVRHSARAAAPRFDYLVDAHDGSVLYYYSAAHRLQGIPAPMTGLDCENKPQNFYGITDGVNYVLVDPLRNIETYDYNFSDLDRNEPLPTQPIQYNAADLGSFSPAAVSAHYHATIVFDFFNDVLKRNGVDDRGMKLISVVNVYASGDGLPHPRWGNAAWHQGKMWYGQEPDANDQLISFARHLDVIGHELTHGVTSTSSNLVYRDLPGALNESFSDIFGVMIANWNPGRPNPLSMWKWEIGAGIGPNGTALRNFADPAAAGQPDHMSQYRRLPGTHDSGGVHIYSGIHNKAVYLLLTAVDANGDPVVGVQEAALLLYLTLARLTPTSDFSASRRTLENIAGVYYANHPRKQEKLDAIASAYQAVGIL